MEISLKQAMTNHPRTVRFKDDLLPAYLRMRREKCRHMPVIDDDGQLVGVISDRDFQRAMAPATGFDAHGLPEMPSFRKDAKVSDYMSWPAITLEEDTDLGEAVGIMIEKKISAVVVTRQGQVSGIITHEDFLGVLGQVIKEARSAPLPSAFFTRVVPLGKLAEVLSACGI